MQLLNINLKCTHMTQCSTSMAMYLLYRAEQKNRYVCVTQNVQQLSRQNRVSCSDSQLTFNIYKKNNNYIYVLFKNVNIKYELGVCTGTLPPLHRSITFAWAISMGRWQTWNQSLAFTISGCKPVFTIFGCKPVFTISGCKPVLKCFMSPWLAMHFVFFNENRKKNVVNKITHFETEVIFAQLF